MLRDHVWSLLQARLERFPFLDQAQERGASLPFWFALVE
jgi:hypothetical protein